MLNLSKNLVCQLVHVFNEKFLALLAAFVDGPIDTKVICHS